MHCYNELVIVFVFPPCVFLLWFGSSSAAGLIFVVICMTVNHDQIQLALRAPLFFVMSLPTTTMVEKKYYSQHNKQPHTEAFQITRAFLCITILGTAA